MAALAGGEQADARDPAIPDLRDGHGLANHVRVEGEQQVRADRGRERWSSASSVATSAPAFQQA